MVIAICIENVTVFNLYSGKISLKGIYKINLI